MAGLFDTHAHYNDPQLTENKVTPDLAQAEGVTETLKAQSQMEWVARMNNIRSRAEEMILNDLIYA